MSRAHAFPAMDGPGRSRRRGLALQSAAAAVLAALALVTAGCSVKGGTENANVIEGKKQFVAKCGSCHTLARAETKGVVGPNLDEAFRASLHEGANRNTVRSIVEGQIQIPNPQGAMPKDLVTGSTLKDVSTYVAQSVDRAGKDTGLLATAVQAPGAGKPAVEKGGKLSIAASPSGQLAYVTDKASGTPGPVTLEMPNLSGVSHNIALEAGVNGATAKGAVIASSPFTTKTTSTVTATLKPGSYTFFCEAPGHRQAGMYGTLTVK